MAPGIDEMPKSQIEKIKRNMESTSRVPRREKISVFWFEKRTRIFAKKKRNLQFSLISRREREILKTNHI